MRSPESARGDGPKVLLLGLPKSGTFSMYEALCILGYKNVHHCLNAIDEPEQWQIINRAADATFENLTTYTGKPFARQDWNTLLGTCDGVTDLAGPFAKALFDVYPDAKVILVERDYEKWAPSFEKSVISHLWGPVADFFVTRVEPMVGSVAGPASRKTLLGWGEATDVDELRANLPRRFKEHYAEIRGIVPADQLLEYKLSAGWEPLCEFLGKEPPPQGTPFPHSNEAKAMAARLLRHQGKLLRRVATKSLPYAVPVVGVAAYWWWHT